MPNFSNVHAELDNNEIHPPRDFSLAEPDTFLSKNPLGDIEWYDTYWQRPVLGFADGSMPPLTLRHGDRYILSGSTSIDNTSIDISVDISVDTSISLDSSVAGENITPTVPLPSTVHPAWDNVSRGDVVEYYRNDNKDNLVFEWRAVTPKQGYQIFNLADRKPYYFNGSTWHKVATDNTSAATAQLAATYAELQSLVADRGLVPGLRYRITDRDIILTAVSTTEFGIEGDYTLLLPARAALTINDSTMGEITSVTVKGTELLAASIETTSSKWDTAAQLADAISAGEGAHGYSAISIQNKVFVCGSNQGADLNGEAIYTSATGATIVTTPFADGVNIGTLWFRVKYDFTNDWITEMKDNRGNVVSATKPLVDLSGLNPYHLFPWQYETVMDNKVAEAVFIAMPDGTPVIGNHLAGQSILMLHLDADSGFNHNSIQNQSLVQLSLTHTKVENNALLTSWMNMEVANGYFWANNLFASSLQGKNIQIGLFSANRIMDTTLLMDDAAIDNISRNEMSYTDIDIVNSPAASIKTSKILEAEIVATGGSFTIQGCEVENSALDISNCTGNYNLDGNRIAQNSDLQMVNAQGTFRENQISNTQLSAANLYADFSRNLLENYCEIALTGFAGSFYENKINRGTHNFIDSSTNITYNHIEGGITSLTNHHGTCTNNRFRYAEVYSTDCDSRIENNFLEYSHLNLNRSDALFSSNNGTYYSVYDLDDYLGERFTLNQLNSGSRLIANNNSSNQGGIIVREATIVDISSGANGLYDCIFHKPLTTIRLSNSFSGRSYIHTNSTFEADVYLDTSGIIDLDDSDAAYASILKLKNSGTLTEITFRTAPPSNFIIIPDPGVVLNIDTSIVKLASGIINVPVDGSLGGFVNLSFQSNLVITNLFGG